MLLQMSQIHFIIIFNFSIINFYYYYYLCIFVGFLLTFIDVCSFTYYLGKVPNVLAKDLEESGRAAAV